MIKCGCEIACWGLQLGFLANRRYLVLCMHWLLCQCLLLCAVVNIVVSYYCSIIVYKCTA
jgi:hypothetical protein